jgi:hypothetical protein
MADLGRHGPKQLLTNMWGVRTTREALLETIGEGLAQTHTGHFSGMARTDWQPWKMVQEVSSDTLYITSTEGRELALPALRFTSRTSAVEMQHAIDRTFQKRTTVTLDALTAYNEPIREYTILLGFTAHPGWMSRGAEMLVYESIVAVRNSLSSYLKLGPGPMFHFQRGGWANLDLAALGTSI